MTTNGHAPRGSFCRRTRREFLWQAGGAFTSVALTGAVGPRRFSGLASPGRRRRHAVRQSARAQAAALRAQGQERDLSVHVRRAQPRRHVRLQAEALQARRPDDSGQNQGARRREERRPRRRAQVEVQAVRPVGAVGLGPVSASQPATSTTSPSSSR